MLTRARLSESEETCEEAKFLDMGTVAGLMFWMSLFTWECRDNTFDSCFHVGNVVADRKPMQQMWLILLCVGVAVCLRKLMKGLWYFMTCIESCADRVLGIERSNQKGGHPSGHKLRGNCCSCCREFWNENVQLPGFPLKIFFVKLA